MSVASTLFQSLLFLGLVATVCLGLNLIFLVAYLVCACCCQQDDAVQTKQRHSCCITWTAVVAGLVCCAAVGVGFYGNSETNDGVYQLMYSLEDANHTFSGIDALVRLPGTAHKVSVVRARAPVRSQLAQLHTERVDQVVLGGLHAPVWGSREESFQDTKTSCTWLSYLLLFILDLVICLMACLGLAKRSKCLLVSMLCCGALSLLLSWASLAADAAAAVATSDFCVAPDTFILNIMEGQISTEVTRYYLYCSQSGSSPFQQTLTTFQRALTTMQIQVAGLLQFAVPLFSTAEEDLLAIQLLLNSSESSLHQLTAMVDCRGLHKDYLDALAGTCYDGLQGLLYLGLFSFLAALAFSTMICAGPRAWKHFTTRNRDYDDIDDDDPFNPQAWRMAAHNPPRGQLHSFCSYSSGLGSQTSLQPPAQTISNAPVSEYMNQAMLFGRNPRYENVPLIGRASPPPTYSPSMRATYLSVADEHLRHYGNQFPA
uniref:Protein tweety homolog n=2 Tax=Colobus angolensis palliatus TaxID=336983 RepID=A0A2K5K4V3_COLAP